MTEAPKPAPCPWCGGEALACEPSDERWLVQCQSQRCLADGPIAWTKQAAIAAWNRVAGREKPDVQ